MHVYTCLRVLTGRPDDWTKEDIEYYSKISWCKTYFSIYKSPWNQRIVWKYTKKFMNHNLTTIRALTLYRSPNSSYYYNVILWKHLTLPIWLKGTSFQDLGWGQPPNFTKHTDDQDGMLSSAISLNVALLDELLEIGSDLRTSVHPPSGDKTRESILVLIGTSSY